MKVYRAVLDSFVTNRKLEQKSIRGLEGIYYQAGYSSFVNKMGYHDYNSLAKDIKKEGKYFFLFAEDAIEEANSLIGGYHRLNMDTCLVIEYDIPEEIILKMIGFGDYTDDKHSLYLIESYIEKDDFGNLIITTDEISVEEKTDFLIRALNESLKRILECQSLFDMIDYLKYFNYKKLESIIDNTEEIANVLINNSFYNSFMDERRQLIQSSYITGKVVPVNRRFWHEKLKNYKQIEDYFQNKGIDCNFSEEQNKRKKEILYYLQQDNQEKEKVKKLLHQIKN